VTKAWAFASWPAATGCIGAPRPALPGGPARRSQQVVGVLGVPARWSRRLSHWVADRAERKGLSSGGQPGRWLVAEMVNQLGRQRRVISLARPAASLGRRKIQYGGATQEMKARRLLGTGSERPDRRCLETAWLGILAVADSSCSTTERGKAPAIPS
jgi:hypothetical protein